MASKRRHRRIHCGTKRRFDTAKGAIAMATSLRRRTGEAYDAYQCKHCGQWHVGHRPYKVQQAISARRRIADEAS